MTTEATIYPALLACPFCGCPHIDEDEWATKPHRTHLCASCGAKWRPCTEYTVGVATLPDNGHVFEAIPTDPGRELSYCRRCGKSDIAYVRRRICLPIAPALAAERIARKVMFRDGLRPDVYKPRGE